MIELFSKPWDEVSTVWLDVESTGTLPGIDAVCQVAAVRFESGVPVAQESSLIDPGREIPITAITIHGITNEAVRGAPKLAEFFARPTVVELLNGAAPGAYNATFDRAFLPLHVWGENWGWPWLDPLTWVRAVDRFAKGAGRHRLEAACERRGIVVGKAHDAGADAEATGRLFYRVVAEFYGKGPAAEIQPLLGPLLEQQRILEAQQWRDFYLWLSKQPPKTNQAKAC